MDKKNSRGRAEKIMSLSLQEFHRGLRALSPDIELKVSQKNATIPVGPGSAIITYDPLEGATFGGLLSLPRAKITIATKGLDEEEAQAFVSRFNKAFQRGGG